MVVLLTNKKTGEQKTIKVGWSWTCFFFSSWFGIPLFLRRLYLWGSFMCVLWFAVLAAAILIYDDNDSMMVVVKFMLSLLSLGISIGFGRHANRLACIQYLKDGWEPLDPAAPEYVHAKRVWKLDKVSAQAA